jgi:hypothetical protein
MKTHPDSFHVEPRVAFRQVMFDPGRRGPATKGDALPKGSWAGPIESGYGLHLVEVTERVEGRVPDLAEVRDAVARDRKTAQRKELSEALFRKLVGRYKVVVEPPGSPASAKSASPEKKAA